VIAVFHEGFFRYFSESKAVAVFVGRLLNVTWLVCLQFLEIRWRTRIPSIKTNTLTLWERE
jgi:glycerol-3-phosphate acyltransferase PlsY